MLRTLATAVFLLPATPAWAEIDPPRRTPAGPDDGAWVQATAVLPVGQGDIAVQYGDLDANRIRYLAVQGERRVGDGFALGLAYAYGGLRLPNAPDPKLQLYRAFATWTNGGERVELDGRLWAEVLTASTGPTTEQLRMRARASVALPGRLPLSPRLFVADELFFVNGDGFTRNRLSLGVRTQLSERLGLDVAWQRSDDTSGAGQNVMLIQTTVVLGRRRGG